MAPRVCEPSLDETIFGRLVSDGKVSAIATLSPLKADHLVIAVLYTRTKSLRLMDPKAKANDPVLNFYAVSYLRAGSKLVVLRLADALQSAEQSLRVTLSPSGLAKSKPGQPS